MPGIVGILSGKSDTDLGTRLSRALKCMQRGNKLSEESALDPQDRWAIGRAHLGVLGPEPQLLTNDSPLVLLHGDVVNRSEISRIEGWDLQSPVETLRRLYHRYGPAFPTRVAGAFIAAILDTQRRRLVLAMDAVGSYPLYCRTEAGECVFSSDLTALLQVCIRKPQLDLRAVADYLTVGFVVGNRTFASNVRMLGPGETLVYDLDTDSASVTCHASLEDLFTPKTDYRTREQYVDAVSETFAESVQRCFDGPHSFALSMSGGLDSRAIIAASGSHARGLSTYTLGIRGCADEVIASQLSKIVGTGHRFFELTDRYLVDFLPNLVKTVSLSDGLYLSHGFTEMLALQFLSDGRSNVLLRGHGGELAKMSLAWPFHTDPAVKTIQNLDELSVYIAQRANYLTDGVRLREVFQSGLVDAAGQGSADSLREVLRQTALTPAQACGYLYLHEHHRRSTIPSMELFRSTLEIRMPFLDVAFLRVLLGGPPEWREGTQLHRAIVRAHHPALLKVRNSNTSAAMDASQLTERVMEKLGELLKRMGISGYRHYHNFQDWMRRMLLVSVQRELLVPGALINGWVAPGLIQNLVTQTSSRANHAYLLQAILILELWQRENGVETPAA